LGRGKMKKKRVVAKKLREHKGKGFSFSPNHKKRRK